MKVGSLTTPKRRFGREATVILGISLVGAALVAMASKSMGDMLQFVVVLAIIVPAFALAALDSSALLGYITLTYVFSPFLRRVTDYEVGHYSSVSLISVAPLIASLAFLVPLLHPVERFEKRYATPLIGLTVGLIFGLSVGLLKNGSAALYEAADYGIPMLCLAYLQAKRPSAVDCDRLVRGVVLIGVAAAVYGWIQFLIVPVWDSFWMREGIKILTNGEPYPFKIRVYGPMASPVPMAAFLAFCLTAAVVDKRWRTPLGWFAVLILSTGLAITLVRSSWMSALLMVLAFALLGQGVNRWRATLGIVVCLLSVVLLAPFLPGGKVIAARAASLQKGSSDFSFQQRVQFSFGMLEKSIGTPLGSGMGSTGVSSKLSNNGALGALADFDNGYLNLVYTFGLIVAAILVGCLFSIGKACYRELDAGLDEGRFARLAVSCLVGAALIMVFNNAFWGAAGFFVWLPIGLAISGRTERDLVVGAEA